MMPLNAAVNDAWSVADPTLCDVCGRESCEDHLPPVDAPPSVQRPTLRALTMRELAVRHFEPRRALICRAGHPVLRAGDISQVYALRGTGKSLYVRTLSIVASSGTTALGFVAPDPCRVLYVDGEMASDEIKGRDETLALALNVLPNDNLVTIAADWQDEFLPRLDTPAGQAALEPFIGDADLIILDNRSTLFDPEGEADPVAWQPAQDWLLSLRRRGKAVVIVHHSNRQGGARGHSKPEDVMNLLVKLTRPDDYIADQGARFKVEFEKSRGVYGAAVSAFTTQLTGSGWIVEDDVRPSGAVQRLREYLRLAHEANERPTSASGAIRAAKVQKAEGLRAWAELLKERQITKHPDGGFVLNGCD
jgi:hypothetical protein